MITWDVFSGGAWPSVNKLWENRVWELGVPFWGELSQVLTTQTINRKLQPDSHSSLKVTDLSLNLWGLQRWQDKVLTLEDLLS